MKPRILYFSILFMGFTQFAFSMQKDDSYMAKMPSKPEIQTFQEFDPGFGVLLQETDHFYIATARDTGWVINTDYKNLNNDINYIKNPIKFKDQRKNEEKRPLRMSQNDLFRSEADQNNKINLFILFSMHDQILNSTTTENDRIKTLISALNKELINPESGQIYEGKHKEIKKKFKNIIRQKKNQCKNLQNLKVNCLVTLTKQDNFYFAGMGDIQILAIKKSGECKAILASSDERKKQTFNMQGELEDLQHGQVQLDDDTLCYVITTPGLHDNLSTEKIASTVNEFVQCIEIFLGSRVEFANHIAQQIVKKAFSCEEKKKDKDRLKSRKDMSAMIIFNKKALNIIKKEKTLALVGSRTSKIINNAISIPPNNKDLEKESKRDPMAPQSKQGNQEQEKIPEKPHEGKNDIKISSNNSNEDKIKKEKPLIVDEEKFDKNNNSNHDHSQPNFIKNIFDWGKKQCIQHPLRTAVVTATSLCAATYYWWYK